MAGATTLPGAVLAEAALTAARRALANDWHASSLGRWFAARPRARGFEVRPHDPRPADRGAGAQILTGAFVHDGETLAAGVRGDPWDRASPSRAFAAWLHGFGWLRDLTDVEGGDAEALRLVLEWRRLFGRWNRFAWEPPVLERRVFNLACAGRALAARASEAETLLLASDLSRSARVLLAAPDGLFRAAERAAAAAVAGAALSGKGGERLLARALARLGPALSRTLTADGAHASRSPQAALELLFDLQALEDALVQRGRAAPEPVLRALDGLAGAVRFFTLADGGLPAMQGGRACDAAYVAAARAQDEAGDRPTPASRAGYQRLDGRRLQLVVDAAQPAAGAWSATGAAQPVALEVLANGRRLIGPAAGRGVDDGSTVSVGERGLGRTLDGFAARALGPRLTGVDGDVAVERHEARTALWLELLHEGWLARYGVRHQRRLYLDLEADELRGEDRLTPTSRVQGPDGRHLVPYAMRFHLHPAVSALPSRDRKSVLLRLEGDPTGWSFRNDALDAFIEPSRHPTGRPSQQIVLRGHRRADSGARVRWKLAPAAAGVDRAKGSD